MRIVKRVLIALVCLVLVFAGAFVACVGPWPLYKESGYRDSAYFARALSDIDIAAAGTMVDRELQPFKAGWAERDITPASGHPMAGYGGRPNEKRSTGVLEPLFVRALAMSDGADTVVLVGSDMLQTLPNLLGLIEPRVKANVGLTNGSILYTSSHTHSGPGGLAPGFAAETSYGEYKPEYVELLATQFADAITEAVRIMAPARFAHGAVEAPEYIRNRTRATGTVDDTLHYALVERIDDGSRLYLARYSAHGTAYSEEMLELNNDYAGAFQRAIRGRTGAPLLFMGGAVGSMRPYPPGPPLPQPETAGQALAFENDIESDLVKSGKKTLEAMLHDQRARVEAMGNALADRLLASTENMQFTDRLDIACLAVPFNPPPAQVRLFSPNWRVSPFLFRILGVPTEGRIQAARIGTMFLVGMPYDFSGETSREWQAWARERGASLWVTSFSGAYLGYLSPDRYYHEIGEGLHYNQNYEIGQMSWFGPDQEAYVTDLFHHVFERLTPAALRAE